MKSTFTFLFKRGTGVFIALAAYSSAAATPLGQPRPRLKTDYNYTNGDVGHQTTGMTLEEAGDIAEAKTPLAAPKLDDAEVSESEKLKMGEDLPERADSCEK